MARSTMARVIQVVRDLTFAGSAEYTLGTASYFTDDHVQAYLDDNRLDVWSEPLRPRILTTAGTPHWTTYEASRAQWESAQDGTSTVWTVRDATGAIQGTALYSADYARGVVTFSADQAGSARYLTGRVYDVHTAAADLVDIWAARWDRQFDFSDIQGQKWSRSQSVEMMGKRAAALRAKGWPRVASLVRSDAADGPEPRDTGYTGGAAHAARG